MNFYLPVLVMVNNSKIIISRVILFLLYTGDFMSLLIFLLFLCNVQLVESHFSSHDDLEIEYL